MKLKILMITGVIAYATAITLAANSTTQTAQALEARQDTTHAELYRFLETTRNSANEQGEALVYELSKTLISSDEFLIDSSIEDEATAAFIQSLADVALSQKSNGNTPREDLLKSLEGQSTQTEIPFAKQDEQEDQQVELTIALSALTNALSNITVSVEEVTQESDYTAVSPKNKDITDESIHDSAIIPTANAETTWTDEDLSEIALCQATSANVPDGVGNCNSKNRSYMRYTAVTSRTSAQYALLNGDSAYTDKTTGFRMVNGRYCIAVGSAYTTKIGTKIDLVMADGTIVRCILGDCKSDRDTDESHMYCIHDGSVAEFIVDYEYFNRNTERNPVNEALGIHCAIQKVVIIK